MRKLETFTTEMVSIALSIETLEGALDPGQGTHI